MFYCFVKIKLKEQLYQVFDFLMEISLFWFIKIIVTVKTPNNFEEDYQSYYCFIFILTQNNHQLKTANYNYRILNIDA